MQLSGRSASQAATIRLVKHAALCTWLELASRTTAAHHTNGCGGRRCTSVSGEYDAVGATVVRGASTLAR